MNIKTKLGTRGLIAATALAVVIVPLTAVQAQGVAPSRASTTTVSQVKTASSNTALTKHLMSLSIRIPNTSSGELSRFACAWRELTGAKVKRGAPTASEKQGMLAATSIPQGAKSLVNGLNVNRTCQIAYWVSGGKVTRVMAVSTGQPGLTTTAGTFKIQWRINGKHNSSKYPSPGGWNMYRPMYFHGGMAVHGSVNDYSVRTYPASHGCVRMRHADVDWLWKGKANVGTTVHVYGAWRG